MSVGSKLLTGTVFLYFIMVKNVHCHKCNVYHNSVVNAVAVIVVIMTILVASRCGT